MKFTKVVPKEIENIFSEFESRIVDIMHSGDCDCINMETLEAHSNDNFQFLLDNKLLENNFDKLIKDIELHLINQFKTYSQIQLVSFIQNQKYNFINYLPEKRKRVIINFYNYYLTQGHEAEFPKGKKLHESDLVYLKHFYKQYQIFYNLLMENTNRLFENYNSVTIPPEPTETISDNEFIKGSITLIFTPQGKSGFYEVEKGNDKRKYTLEKYFDLHLQNWENFINNLSSKAEKLKAVNNAIFNSKKDLFDEKFHLIKELMNKNISHLESIEKYINLNYPDILPTKLFKKRVILTAEAVALFCSIIHQSGIMIRGFESVESYCNKVCKEFMIKANPKKVRQFFSEQMTLKQGDKYLKNVSELILPNLQIETKLKIEIYINNKIKMYG